MHNPFFEWQGKHIHFAGIGGCGMSGLARMARSRGAIVTGSDRQVSDVVDALRTEGFDVAVPQNETTVPTVCDLLVATAALPQDHPELRIARQQGIEVVKYAHALGMMMAGREGVAIAGTHGKSTTVSLLCHILLGCDKDPSFILGAQCKQIGGGARSSEEKLGHADEILVTEACEYDRSFHALPPKLSAILNVEADHLDVYGNLEGVVNSFAHFAGLLPEDGFLLIEHDSPHRLPICAGLDCTIETIGFSPQADWQVVAIEAFGRRGLEVSLVRDGCLVARWLNPMPGSHFAYNACVAAVLANRLGCDWGAVCQAIEGFEGLDRRMQRVGRIELAEGEATVVDDYGHHPTEVDMTLRALRRFYRPDRLTCIFQPHQHSRTRFLLDEFAVSFSVADRVIVPDIYFARDSEQDRMAVTGETLVERLQAKGQDAIFAKDINQLATAVRERAKPGELIVTMGAGDIWKVAHGCVDHVEESGLC